MTKKEINHYEAARTYLDRLTTLALREKQLGDPNDEVRENAEKEIQKTLEEIAKEIGLDKKAREIFKQPTEKNIENGKILAENGLGTYVLNGAPEVVKHLPKGIAEELASSEGLMSYVTAKGTDSQKRILTENARISKLEEIAQGIKEGSLPEKEAKEVMQAYLTRVTEKQKGILTEKFENETGIPGIWDNYALVAAQIGSPYTSPEKIAEIIEEDAQKAREKFKEEHGEDLEDKVYQIIQNVIIELARDKDPRVQELRRKLPHAIYEPQIYNQKN